MDNIQAIETRATAEIAACTDLRALDELRAIAVDDQADGESRRAALTTLATREPSA
ncbi:MAG: hypothetical protein HC808_20280 [Candidatus Competibacteraceae bacterium]|nr:hypothetical protein [Candidatus Competibacteraceae bacterium]